VSSCELDDERDDDREDHSQAGECGGVDVDLPEALVASVAAEPADRRCDRRTGSAPRTSKIPRDSSPLVLAPMIETA